MKDDTIVLISFIFVIIVALTLVYTLFTGDWILLGSGGTIEDCIPDPVWGGCLP